MTTTAQAVTVNKSVTVKAGLEHAFKVFTEGFDTWWPRGHHIGKKPLQKAVIEPRVGGRCYGREADGSQPRVESRCRGGCAHLHGTPHTCGGWRAGGWPPWPACFCC